MIPQADVLIVTATPVESRAVLDAFAGITGQPARPMPVGDRIYHDLGEVHDARVFLALTEMGSGGLGASQQTVQKGIVALRPAAVILVGIAGCIPILWHCYSRQPGGTRRPEARVRSYCFVRAGAAVPSVGRHCG